MARVGDQDPTPKFNRRVQTGEDQAARRQRPKAYPLGFGVVIPPAPPAAAEADDLTSPFELLDRDPDPEVHAVIERSPRNGNDPATYEDVAKLAVALIRERSGNRQRDKDAEEVLRAPREATRSSRRHLIIAAIAAATSLAGAIDHRVSHPARPVIEAPDAVRVHQLEEVRDQLQHQVDRLDAELRQVREQLGRRSQRTPLAPAGASPAFTTVTPQGTNP